MESRPNDRCKGGVGEVGEGEDGGGGDVGEGGAGEGAQNVIDRGKVTGPETCAKTL